MGYTVNTLYPKHIKNENHTRLKKSNVPDLGRTLNIWRV